jgi:two-component system, OmpR family, heavy metal sensor histidine kinase CusS
MKTGSIRVQLTAWYAAILCIGLIVFSCTIWFALRHFLYADLESSVIDQARGLNRYLRIEDQDTGVSLPAEIDEYSQSMPQNHLLAVFDAEGKAIYQTPTGLTQDSQAAGRPYMLRWQGHAYLAVVQTVLLKDGRVHTLLAISSEPVQRAVYLLGVLLSAAVPLFVVGAAAGGFWLSRRALRPVDAITERARTIGLSNLSERLPVPNTNDELQRLTETWNAMLARLQSAISKISQFTADASHELRTPVAIIRLAAENALRKTRSETEYQEALQRIQKESENMTQLIEDLLFLARADFDRDSGETGAVDLGALIDSVCLDLSPLAEAKAVTVTQKIGGHPIEVLGSLSALRRMLVILLDNAIKYTPAGGAVTIILEQRSEHATVTVEDTGIGIPDDARSRVFRRFFRADPSRSKESGGHGLGLAIAQTIVEQHGASIELRPASHGGSIFSVSLPLRAPV